MSSLLFFKDFIYLFLERGRKRERGRETSMCGCLSSAPYWAPGPQTRSMCPDRESTVTLWFSVPCSIHWAIPARVITFFIIRFLQVRKLNLPKVKMDFQQRSASLPEVFSRSLAIPNNGTSRLTHCKWAKGISTPIPFPKLLAEKVNLDGGHLYAFWPIHKQLSKLNQMPFFVCKEK